MPRWTLAALLALTSASPAAAQEMRDFTTSRQLHGESRLDTRLEFAAGSLRLHAGNAKELYRMRLSYDAERFVPLNRFDPAAGSARLGVESNGRSGIRVSSRNQLNQDATVTLSPDVTLALDIELGAVEADIDLGGMRLADLRLETGASRTLVRFSRPNTTRCGTAVIESGAAEVALVGLGNSRCERISFAGGVGTATVDLGGTWTSDATLDLSMTMGEITLRLPKSVGIRVVMDRFLSKFPSEGWVRQGNTYSTPGYARSPRKVEIQLSSTIGGVAVEWMP